MSKRKSIDVGLNLGVFYVKGTWEPNENERKAAWEMYVELITRVSAEGLRAREGILRESLNSLYSIFDCTRIILKKYGTDVARPRKRTDEYSFGLLAVMILNQVLRPFLTKWHPILEEYEAKKPEEMSIKAYEDKWEQNDQMRAELNDVRRVLICFSYYLARIAEVTPLWKPAAEHEDE